MITFAIFQVENQDRYIGVVENGEGPVVLVTAGLHGNEASGVIACQRFLKELNRSRLTGKLIMLRGNTAALAQNVRMIDYDLNRVWQEDRVIRDLEQGPLNELKGEAADFHELNMVIDGLLKEGELTLLDLHTTSAQTVPFITMADTLMNRDFIEGLGVPVVIGIEEYLSGPLLSYVMEKGQRSMAFESGSHADPGSAERHYHFLWLALDKIGAVQLNDNEKEHHLSQISFSKQLSNAVYDVRHREEIQEEDKVKVLPGFRNFDIVKPGQKLAQRNGRFVLSDRHCRIFMPLYQSQGSDAYFLIGRMPAWWKFLSRMVRRMRFDRFITLIPGTSRISENLINVKPKLAKSRIKHVLHLSGYRFLTEQDGLFRFIRREA